MNALKRIDPLLLGILGLAFALRVQGIDDDGFWLDEVTSLRDAEQTVGALFHGKGAPSHPPLYYVLLKGWVSLFGTSETAVRFLSAVFGTAAVGATFALFRALHGRATGLAASLLVALSFHHIVFSQEARMYALFGFLALASAHALWRALAEGGRRRWILCVVWTVLMVYSHHLACVVLFGETVAAVLAATIGRVRKGALRGFALAAVAVAAAATPSIAVYMYGGIGKGAHHGYRLWQPHVSWQGLVDLAVVWTPGGPLLAKGSFLYGPSEPRVPWLPWMLVALALPAVFLALAWVRSPARKAPVLFHLGTLYAALGAYLVLTSIKPIWHVRYAVVLLPFYLGGLATLLAALRAWWARLAVVAVAVALSIPGLVAEKRRLGRTPWREMTAYVAGQESTAVFMIGGRTVARPFRWYYARPFELVATREALVAGVLKAAERGGTVIVVYCNAHGPPDPHHLGAWQLKQTLDVRGGRSFGPLRVYLFVKRPP